MSSWLGFSSVGFAGARSGAGAAAAGPLAAAAASAGCQVLATCGAGVPAVALAAAGPLACAFVAHSGPWASLPYRQRLAARASAMVRALAAAPSPVLFAWPAGPLAVAASPGRSWQSVGSGTWSEVLLALGLGVPVILFGQPAPAGVPSQPGPLPGSLLLLPAVAGRQPRLL